MTTPYKPIHYLLLAALLACSPDEPAPDGGRADGAAEADGGCAATEPVCQEGEVVACVDGLMVTTPCQDNEYCSHGECRMTAVIFPDDAAAHLEQSEWWYYTGHLEGETGQWGFEVTIFQYDLRDLLGLTYMCHVAVTDKAAGEHYHWDEFIFTPATLTAAPPELQVGQCHFRMDGFGRDQVEGAIPEGEEKDGKASPWEVRLEMTAQKGPAYHGGDGIIPMSDAGGTSWYYSYTRMAITGTLLTPEGEVEVSGQGWMDHQWGPFDMAEFKGWDWWSMQLEDGWEIMLFQFTSWEGELVSQAGTILDPQGNQTDLEGLQSFLIQSLRTWASPHTDGVYPLDWDISIPSPPWELQVRTTIDDQEMHNPAQNYWEGNTIIEGTRGSTPVGGIGYTELTGYASDALDP